MRFGQLNLFCPMCSRVIRLNTMPNSTMHSNEFGYVCSRKCYEAAELKYARMILGKDDDLANVPAVLAEG
jgi:hypothetical protein